MPKSKKFVWQIYSYYLLLLLVSCLTVILYTAHSLRQYTTDSALSRLTSSAVLFRKIILQKPLPFNEHEINALCREMVPFTSARYTVILPTGRVIGDSDSDPARMENHLDRPEVLTALSGKIGTSIRYSSVEPYRMMYVAVPVESNGSMYGVVRTSLKLDAVNRELNSFYGKAVIAAMLLSLLGLIFSLIISRKLNKSLVEVKQGISRFSSDDLAVRLHVQSAAEIEELADTLNVMADHLETRINTVTRQRNELEAVLSGMAEAVIAVDMNERIINSNHAAESLFGFTFDQVRGRTVQEVIRNSRLQNFIKRVLSSDAPVTDEIIVQFRTDRFLQAHGSILLDSSNRNIGALIVLNDVTRLKLLETIRREFVANVSHELKTPITSIKGFVETLKDGAMHDPVNAQKFLDIILKHTDRLNAIIEDLLSLSRVEQEAENEQIYLEPVRVGEIVKNALLVCDSKAGEKGIRIEFRGNEDIEIMANPDLLEQAVVNLLDNAIKYSGRQSRILVEVSLSGADTAIKVEDHGIGIPEEHLQRIFERFYRVDKARSRELGGTGLGLAIVKHIVQAHHGRVDVTSAPGKGSTFFIYIPKKV
ncbi:MAG: ATP-binding protein [Candidatus Latescibacter sp.]|nr:ATP-binding protein [Candidatus Latescibacter sp.]